MSLFEQYEQAAQKSADLIVSNRFPCPELSSSRIIPLVLQDEEPIFSKGRLSFSPSSPITYMTTSNGYLVMALANKTILRMNLSRPDNSIEEIDLIKAIGESAAQAKIKKLFLDFTGNHLLISVVTKDGELPLEVFYLNRKSKKPRSANKMKAHVVTAVAWDYIMASDTSTGYILIGTNKGVIYQASLNGADDRYPTLTSLEQYFKQFYDFGKDEPTTITGLKYHVLSDAGNKCFILVTTPTRLYEFSGSIPGNGEPLVISHVSNNYPDVPAAFQEIPSALPYSQLQFHYPQAYSLPNSAAWMTGVGVLFSVMDYSGSDTVRSDTKLLTYPKDKDSENLPLSMVLTEFHVLVLFKDRVKVICTLNDQLIMDDIYTETYGKMVQLVKDPITGIIWAFSEYALYRYSVTRENRNVWHVYLLQGEYDLAKQYCMNDSANLDIVRTKQADDYFNRKMYDESAELYAQTQVSFEEVTLKFLQNKQKNALKIFLKQKLDRLSIQEKTQKTMIVTWLVELYLNQLGELRDGRQTASASYKQLRDEFQSFLRAPVAYECISNNSNTIYDLISSHGDQNSLVEFAELINDYERVITFDIQTSNYKEALNVLRKQKRVNLFYQFCPILMQHVPTETINACIELGRKLDPSKLIPSLVHYNQNHGKSASRNEAIRYLEFCVGTLNVKDRTIHNYLMSLYAKNVPEKLEPYLHSYGQNPATACYDLEYALRICSECGLLSACVHIYAVMGLYEEAVDLALKINVEKAKVYADRPEEDEELRKKLWLKIARHVVKEDNDITKAMEFLQQCDLIKIEDILPFFPNFVTIDHFKDAICQALLEYNQHIEGLKEEMEEATQSTKEIRAEIQAFRNKCYTIRSQDKCSSCNYPVLSCSFYLFPCRHFFHLECLVAEVAPNVNTTKRLQLESIQKQLATLGFREEVVPIAPANTSVPSVRDQLRAQLDDILAAECPYCGEMMIKNVDTPFIQAEEYEAVRESWE